MSPQHDIRELASAAWFEFYAKRKRENEKTGATWPHSNATSSTTEHKRDQDQQAVAFSFVARTEEEVVGILRTTARVNDANDVCTFNARVRAGEILSSMLIRERALATGGFYSFYHSIGPKMLAVAATITALAQKFGNVAMSPRSVILRPPIDGISNVAQWKLQDIINQFLAGIDTQETARTVFASVVMSATNDERAAPHMRKTMQIVQDAVSAPGVVCFDPEISVPHQLRQAHAYSRGPVSAMNTQDMAEHAVQKIVEILEASGIQRELGDPVARRIVDLPAPTNNMVQLSFRKDIAPKVAFVTTNGSKHAFLLEDAVRDSVQRREPLYYQARVVCDYAILADSRCARTRVYHASSGFDFDAYVAQIKQMMEGLSCKWPPSPLKLRLPDAPQAGTNRADTLANQQLKRLKYRE